MVMGGRSMRALVSGFRRRGAWLDLWRRSRRPSVLVSRYWV
jgi:hypothetical protein